MLATVSIMYQFLSPHESAATLRPYLSSPSHTLCCYMYVSPNSYHPSYRAMLHHANPLSRPPIAATSARCEVCTSARGLSGRQDGLCTKRSCWSLRTSDSCTLARLYCPRVEQLLCLSVCLSPRLIRTTITSSTERSLVSLASAVTRGHTHALLE